MELAALDGGDDVGRRARHAGLRDHDGLRGIERLGDRGHRLERLGLAAAGEIVAGDGDAQAADALVQERHRRIGRPVGADRIVGIPALHGVERQREILDRAGDRPEMVEGVDEGERAGAAQPAVGRLQAEQAAQRGRHADRAVGVGAQRQRHLARRHRSARAARRAAGHARRVARIAARPVVGVLAGEVVGVLAHVEAADQDRAGRLELAHQRAVARGLRSIDVDLRAGARRQALDVEQVLDRERHAGQRAAMGAGIDLRRALAGARGQDVGEGVDGGLAGLDAGQRRLDDGGGLDLAAHHGAGDVGRGRLLGERIGHGRNTGADVSSSSSSTSSSGLAISIERS